jgi:hypothetical protein
MSGQKELTDTQLLWMESTTLQTKKEMEQQYWRYNEMDWACQ